MGVIMVYKPTYNWKAPFCRDYFHLGLELTRDTWAMVNTHYMVDGHPIYNKDPYNGYYKSLWTIGWLAPVNGY